MWTAIICTTIIRLYRVSIEFFFVRWCVFAGTRITRSNHDFFADWELDDCGDEQQNQNNDDLGPFTGALPVSSTRSNNKLGFYTIGTYDFDGTSEFLHPSTI